MAGVTKDMIISKMRLLQKVKMFSKFSHSYSLELKRFAFYYTCRDTGGLRTVLLVRNKGHPNRNENPDWLCGTNTSQIKLVALSHKLFRYSGHILLSFARG